jgi:acyl-CoA synthetase (AMP-forming)/AMP-acid ligase II
MPKGAPRKTPGGFGPLISIIERIPLRAQDRILISAPLFHTWGYAAMQLCFALRATIVLQRRFDPQRAKDALEAHECHAMFAVPVMLQRMMELPPDPDGRSRRSHLRVVATSGSAYPHGFTTTFMDEYGDVLYNLYGSTEASWVCIATPENLRRDPNTAGTPPLGTVVRILDLDGRDVAAGETGRIFCGNDLVFEGYTSGASKDFVDGLVSTGDMGHEKDGLYYVDGRDDDMIVSGGENVYPIEVESLLIEHPAVREVSVVGVPDPEFGQRLAAFVALHDGHDLSADEVKEHVKANRARHCVPREVHFVDELPRNATGKILARELRKRIT